MKLQFESMFSFVLLLAYILLLGHLLLRFFKYLFDFIFAKDKKEWRNNRKFRDYYIELHKLKAKGKCVSILKDEPYLLQKTLRRKALFCLELFLFGAVAICLLVYNPIIATDPDVEEFISSLFGFGSFFEIVAVLKFVASLHNAVTPAEFLKDLQESEKSEFK